MATFTVYISDNGLAEIDGDPLVPAPEQSVHEAVLDQLHRYAQERGVAVDATVHDSPGGAEFFLRVLPDGSSQVLGAEETPAVEPEPERVLEPEPVLVLEPEPMAELAPEPEPAHARADADAVAEAGPGPGPGPGGGAVAKAGAVARAGVGALATAVARARATAAARSGPAPVAHAAHAAPVAAPAPVVVPTEHAAEIGHINALASVGRLDEALDEATELRERLTSTVGADHPHALEARSVEAYLAHLCGDHREAIVLALAVARIRCGAGDSQAPVEVARAAAAWQQLDDDRAAVAHGRELLHMWKALEARGLLSPGDLELAEQVRRHVDALAAYV